MELYFRSNVEGSDQVASQLFGRLKESGLLSGNNALPPHLHRLPAVMHTPIAKHAATTNPDLEYAAAAWQLTRGEHDYYGASAGWLDGDWAWQPIYNRLGECGAPLGPPVLSMRVWTRRFARCVVSVNTDNQTGVIETVSPSPPPAPPSPPLPPWPAAAVGSAVDVFGAGDGGVPCHRIPVLLNLPDGSLLAMVEARSWLGDNCYPSNVSGTLTLDNTTRIVTRVSAAGEQGKRWGPTTVVMGAAGKSFGDFAAVALANGTVLVTACAGDAVSGSSVCDGSPGQQSNRNVMAVSRRMGGESWSEVHTLALTRTIDPKMAAVWNPTGGIVLGKRVVWCGHARTETGVSYVAVWATEAGGTGRPFTTGDEPERNTCLSSNFVTTKSVLLLIADCTALFVVFFITVVQQPVLLRGLDESQMVLVGGRLPVTGPAELYLSSRGPKSLGSNYPRPSHGDKYWRRRLYARSTTGGQSWFDVGGIDSGVVDPRCQVRGTLYIIHVLASILTGECGAHL